MTMTNVACHHATRHHFLLCVALFQKMRKKNKIKIKNKQEKKMYFFVLKEYLFCFKMAF
jgi:hypothetical protein